MNQEPQPLNREAKLGIAIETLGATACAGGIGLSLAEKIHINGAALVSSEHLMSGNELAVTGLAVFFAGFATMIHAFQRDN